MSSLAEGMASGLVREDVPLGPMTTYKSGGPARYYAEPPDMEALQALVGEGIDPDIPVLVLGRGSNLVVADSGFPGLVVHLGDEFSRVSLEAHSRISAGGAAPLPRVARMAVDAGLAGLEFFVGVPGSVGGAVRQNAGCFGQETVEVLVEARVLDLDDGVITVSGPEDLDMGYRHSSIGPRHLVVDAIFQARPGNGEASREKLRTITRWRRDHQPGGTLNAGSVFKNPPNTSAGQIIDELGLKGLSVGDVSVSEKHANFFVAGPKATSAQIAELVDLVKDQVFQATGTMLVPEIQFIGFDQ